MFSGKKKSWIIFTWTGSHQRVEVSILGFQTRRTVSSERVFIICPGMPVKYLLLLSGHLIKIFIHNKPVAKRDKKIFLKVRGF